MISAGCKEFVNSTLFDKKNSTFSQAPGTVVVLSCSLNKEREVTLICQDDGQWEPNLDDLLCTAGIFHYSNNFMTSHNTMWHTKS